MLAEPLHGGRDLLEQNVRYTYDAPVRRLRHRLMVVPRAVHGRQVLADWDLQVSGAGVERALGTDRFGNQVVELRAARVDEQVEFSLSAVVQPAGCPDGTVPLSVAPPVGDLLELTPLTRPDTAMRAAAAELARGSTSTLDFAERECSWAHASLAYHLGATSVKTTAAAARAGGYGVCQDFAHIMLAVCRAEGVAARYVSGHLLGEGGSPAWVEVVTGPSMAVAFDPTHDRRAGAGYLTVAVGRDYADVAPTSGTFSGPGPGSLSVRKRLRFVDSE